MSHARVDTKSRWNQPADAGAVGHLRHCVAAFAGSAGMAGAGLSDLELAVTEAVTNVVVHAYNGIESGAVDVLAAQVDECVEVTVCDRGIGIRPRTDSPGLGLGLSLIATLARDTRITDTHGGGTTVWMQFAR